METPSEPEAARTALSKAEYRVDTRCHSKRWTASVLGRMQPERPWFILKQSSSWGTESAARDQAERWLAAFRESWSWGEATRRAE